VKGGHLGGPAIDILLHEGEFHRYETERIETPHTHGTGCTFSAAITAALAHGTSLPDAVRQAKEFITKAIRTSPGLGSGNGPVNHFA
jgi:hydroxymethylpyrimidine/phosphomethylpyrimidine kinase